jgi:threonine aldolase
MSTSSDVIPSNRAFRSDNTAGASPEVVKAVAAAAAGYVSSYGDDPYTGSVRHRLSEIFERDVEVLLVSTGTAANCLGLAALPHPGTACCATRAVTPRRSGLSCPE